MQRQPTGFRHVSEMEPPAQDRWVPCGWTDWWVGGWTDGPSVPRPHGEPQRHPEPPGAAKAQHGGWRPVSGCSLSAGFEWPRIGHTSVQRRPVRVSLCPSVLPSPGSGLPLPPPGVDQQISPADRAAPPTEAPRREAIPGLPPQLHSPAQSNAGEAAPVAPLPAALLPDRTRARGRPDTYHTKSPSRRLTAAILPTAQPPPPPPPQGPPGTRGSEGGRKKAPRAAHWPVTRHVTGPPGCQRGERRRGDVTALSAPD